MFQETDLLTLYCFGSSKPSTIIEKQNRNAENRQADPLRCERKNEKGTQYGVIISANKNSARENPRAVIGRRSPGPERHWLRAVYSIFKLTFTVAALSS